MPHRTAVPPLAGLFLALVLQGWAAPEPDRTDEDFLQTHQIGLDDASLLTFFRQRTLTDADRQKLEQMIRQLGSADFAQREEASVELVKRGVQALPLLRQALKNADPEI